ncbi:Nicalin [Fasciola hepatica]|uniref:Nicalin n=1 Tax=Fasciola hepatica TaxID=6192 RepID=A0A4E0RTA1_FASHE|nr:Nicalin [Fasciola hepatica]
MARIFSRFYADPATTPKYDLLFLLSGGGKFNFMGTKRWLDQKIEDTTGLNMLDSVTQVICLESLGTAQFGRNLHVHLSRPPKDGSFSQRFIDSLRLAAQLHPFPSTDNSTEASVQVVHKKINLNQELLGWEHERFSIHRLPGMTLSSWPSVQVANQWRQTSLDGGPLSQPTTTSKTSRMRGTVDPSVISRNTRVITEALIRVLLDLDGQESAFNSSTLVTKEVEVIHIRSCGRLWRCILFVPDLPILGAFSQNPTRASSSNSRGKDSRTVVNFNCKKTFSVIFSF